MKKLLIIVDYQNDFVNGVLGSKQAMKIKTPIYKEIQKYVKNKDQVIFLQDTHDKKYLQSIEGKNLPIEHTIKGSKGWQICEPLNEYATKSNCFSKPTFGSLKLVNYLTKHKFESIQVCGLLTNMCVMVNTIIAQTCQPNTKIFINKKLVASNDKSLEEATFKILKNLFINII